MREYNAHGTKLTRHNDSNTFARALEGANRVYTFQHEVRAGSSRDVVWTASFVNGNQVHSYELKNNCFTDIPKKGKMLYDQFTNIAKNEADGLVFVKAKNGSIYELFHSEIQQKDIPDLLIFGGDERELQQMVSSQIEKTRCTWISAIQELSPSQINLGYLCFDDNSDTDVGLEKNNNCDRVFIGASLGRRNLVTYIPKADLEKTLQALHEYNPKDLKEDFLLSSMGIQMR